MGDRLRLAVGVVGNAASLLRFASPILTFSRVIKKKSTEDFSCIPYIVSLLSCLSYTWYGLPIVSNKLENIPLVTVSVIGILLQTSYIGIFFRFATSKAKMKVAIMLVPVIILFCTTAIISVFLFHDHHNRKLFVGTVTLVAAVMMCGSPLVAVRQVIRTKSVKSMPFYLSLFSFLSSLLWMIYGLLSHEWFIASANMASTPLGLLQLIIYFIYMKRGNKEEPNRLDLEQKKEKSVRDIDQSTAVTDGDKAAADQYKGV